MTVAGEPTSQLWRAQYSGVTSESGTSGWCLRYSVNWNDASSGRKYSRIMRPIMPPAESRIASASVSAMKTSRTRRQSARLGVRPLRAAPCSTASQWLPTYAGLRFRLIGQKPRLGHQQIGRRMRLPGRGVVLADPRLAEAQLVRPAQLLQIPLVAVVETTLRWVRGHREQPVIHRTLLVAAQPAYATPHVGPGGRKAWRTTSWSRKRKAWRSSP